MGFTQMKLAQHEVDQKNMTEKDNNSSKTHSIFCSPRWFFLGFGCILIGAIGHLAVLPFADVTLLTTICAFGILFTTGLSICMLGEVFVWRYDLVATLLVIVGSVSTIVQMNTKVDLVYDRVRVESIIYSQRCAWLMVMTLVLTVVSIWQGW